jgi:WD40 repeat protein
VDIGLSIRRLITNRLGLRLFLEPHPTQYSEFWVSSQGYGDRASSTFLVYRSKDAVIHLWNLPQTPNVKTKSIKPYQAIDCSSAKADADLTSLDWNCHGTLLSVGSYDATLRIYTASAELYFESRLHKVSMTSWPITCTKNRRSLLGPYIRDTLFQGREMACYC